MSLPPVLERMLALWNGEDVDPADVYASPCKLNAGETFEPHEVGAAKLRAAIPNLTFTLEEWFAAGDRYVVRMTAAGSHTGEPLESVLGTLAPSGKSFSIDGFEVFEVRDDRIVDVWVGFDWAALSAALGGRLAGSA